jgi:adenylylsulfate kinase-like enzyme
MSIANEFNALNGMIVHRKDLEKLLEKAERERHTIISKRVIKVLEAFADDTFLIEIKNLVEPYGLNGKKPERSKKEPKFEVYTNNNPDREWHRTPKPLKEIVKPVANIKKKTKAKPIVSHPKIVKKKVVTQKGLNAPKVEVKTIAKEKTAIAPKVIQNKNSLAYKMANKPKEVDCFEIEDRDISEFLGQVERKNKESVVVSLTGGQGSMKTRMCFQFMNALAQKYKTGHASIEEHPESNVYYDKAEQYLNQKALQNIEAPEIKTIAELESLIKKNDVIVIDSFTKMQDMEKGFEVDKDLRKKYDGKLFIVIFQQTTDGKMRGGSKSQFDADIVLFTEKKDDYRENYIYADKNRYQKKPLNGLKFNIFSKKLQGNEPEATAEPTTKRKLSFIVN